MKNRLRGISLAVVAGALFFNSGMFWAQTVSGTISGKVTDREGNPVPGATVTVTGTAIQGSRTAVCDAVGRYTLPHLPVGDDYRIKAEGPGFAAAMVESRAVHPESVVVQDFSLGESGSEVTVTASGPALNLRQAVAPIQLPEKELKAMPVLGEFSDRSYQSVLYWSPAATQSRVSGNPATSGATGIENIYQVDGLTTNDPVLGTWGTNLNVVFLKQVQGETSSFEAADAASTGGYYSLVTRSGSDTFHGDLFMWGTTSALTSDKKADDFGTVEVNDFRALDWGGTFSGPLVKEKLWFFLGVNPYRKVERQRGTTHVTSTLNGSILDIPTSYDNTTRTLGHFGKITWQVNPKHQLELSFFGDPSQQKLNEGTFATLFDDARASRRAVGSTNAVLRWYASFRPNLFLDAHLGITRLKNDITPDREAAWSNRAIVSLDWNQSLAVSRASAATPTTGARPTSWASSSLGPPREPAWAKRSRWGPSSARPRGSRTPTTREAPWSK